MSKTINGPTGGARCAETDLIAQWLTTDMYKPNWRPSMPPRLTPTLDQAIANLLSSPISADHFGYAHYIPVEYFDALREAYTTSYIRPTGSASIAPDAIDYGIVVQDGTIDGVPIRLGGKHSQVSITIQQGDRVYIGHAKRELAKQIAAHLFTSTLRLFGRGRWVREPKGAWILEDFAIHDFVTLKQGPLHQVVEELRAQTRGKN